MLDVADCALIVLAAGRSSRMGSPKGLLTVGAATLVAHQVRRFRAAGGVTEVVVVIGGDGKQYRERLAGCTGLRCVDNLRPEDGPFSSVQTGLRALGGARAVFVLPVDVPGAEVRVWSALAAAVADGAEAAIPTLANGRGGHPVLVSAALAARLATLDVTHPDARLDVQLRAAQTERVLVTDESIALNLNDEAQFLAWRSAAARCTETVDPFKEPK